MNREYTAFRNSTGVQVMMVNNRGSAHFLIPERSMRYRLASRGFDFGNIGKGSEQLAFAILLEELNDPRLAEDLCRDFLEQCVAKWRGDLVTITSAEIQKWVGERKPKLIPA